MVDLYPHQQKAVRELSNGKILWGDVGTGKTIVALTYYQQKEAPKDVYIITTAKKRDSMDWQKDAALLGILHEKVTVDSWNNLSKYAVHTGAFFIFDEQRLVGSGAWTKAFIKIAKANRWILLTATPGDTWLDYIPVFVANGFYKNRSQFIQEHVIYNAYSKFPKVDRYVGVGTLVRHKNSLLVHMSYLRHTTRITKVVNVDYDQDKFERVWKKRWHVYEQRPLRDVAELFLVMRKVVNSDSSRIRAMQKLMSVHPRLIVFYNHNYELSLLRTLADTASSEPTPRPADTTSSHTDTLTENTSASVAELNSSGGGSSSVAGNSTSTTTSGFENTIQIAEWNGHKHEPIPTSDRWVYLVQYQAGAEGWNCTDTDAMVFYSLTYSYKLWHQAHGRIDRLNTPFSTLHYYVFMSKSLIDSAIWKSLKNKKSFNEKKFVEG